MTADSGAYVSRLVRWLRDKIENRQGRDGDHDPWWVTLMLDLGRPLVAVLILGMCAPGEHYLAVQAGWSETLAWGMPGALTAYAGIAAVVATKRPKHAPGRATAVAGAVVSVGLAMAAQPVAHLYGRTGLDTREIALTVAAGVVPAAVFGHLLHMGASAPKPVSRPADSSPVATVTRLRPRPAPVPAAVPSPKPVSRPSVPSVSLVKRPRPGQLAAKQNLSARALELVRDGTDEDTIKDMLRKEFAAPDGTPPKPDSVRKAINRAVRQVAGQAAAP